MPTSVPDQLHSLRSETPGNKRTIVEKVPSTNRQIIVLFGRAFYSVLTLIALGLTCINNSIAANPDWHPEAASAISSTKTGRANHFMAVTAHPAASDAALAILNQGGSAIDAAIAAQMVLGLVEPQSSGIGGGAFLLYWNAEQKQLLSYDGRETAPLGADESLFLNKQGDKQETAMPFLDAIVGGRSVGTPGIIKMLALAHQQQGILPWRQLFQAAISLSKNGFSISERLHRQLQWLNSLDKSIADSRFKQHFYTKEGSPLPVGTLLRNSDYANTLGLIANKGVDGFYQGELATKIIAAVQHHPDNPGTLGLKDLQDYQALLRDPLCGQFYRYTVCGAPPPSSGASTILAILNMLEHKDIHTYPAHSADFIHLFAETSKLAFADRNTYIADPDYVDIPLTNLLDQQYLQHRAALINQNTSLGKATAGRFDLQQSFIKSISAELPSTSHLSIVDAKGNIVSMTSSIEMAFGSRQMVGGFLLNNQLTDFSFAATDKQGNKVANRVGAGKRPRSSMSPLIVFREKMQPHLVIGSPGGARIIDYVARVLVEVLALKQPLDQAVSAAHIVDLNHGLELEQDRIATHILDNLEKRGHSIKQKALSSGIHAIEFDRYGNLWGVADPRREGAVAGK